MNIIYKKFTREDAINDPKGMYIFTDNTNRSSGNIAVGEGWYGRTYGLLKCRPNKTTSCIRGLNNAYPITLQKYCWKGSYEGGKWEDKDFEEFKLYLNEDIARIKDNLKQYEYIVMPEGGLFNRSISQITLERTPKIYKYLLINLINLDK